MKYEQLSEDLRQRLEARKFSAIRYSSGAEERNDKVDDAILLEKGSEISVDRLEGYSVTKVLAPWFEYVSAPYGDDEAKCVEIAENALV